MYLPEKYKNFSSSYPKIFKAYREMGTLVRESGPLDEKTIGYRSWFQFKGRRQIPYKESY